MSEVVVVTQGGNERTIEVRPSANVVAVDHPTTANVTVTPPASQTVEATAPARTVTVEAPPLRPR